MFSKNLKSLRKEKKISQEQLGRVLHISQRSVSRYESGEVFPSEIILNSIADFFDVSVDYLLGRTNIKNIYKTNESS